MKQDQQKHIRECLAQAIFHKVLDMEVRTVLTLFVGGDWGVLAKPHEEGSEPEETGKHCLPK